MNEAHPPIKIILDSPTNSTEAMKTSRPSGTLNQAESAEVMASGARGPVTDRDEDLVEGPTDTPFNFARTNERVDRALSEVMKTAKWPGALLSVAGLSLVLGVTVAEIMIARLATPEFIAALTVGAVILLAGPLVVVYSERGVQATTVDISENMKVAEEAALTREREKLEFKVHLEHLLNQPKA